MSNHFRGGFFLAVVLCASILVLYVFEDNILMVEVNPNER